MDRVILHCDCNSYYASVESIGRPELRAVPMAVCGDPEGRRGIILAKNEPAKKLGIVTAETIYSALRKCPELVLVRAHHKKYQEYCKKINAIYEQYSDQVEMFSVDESWLDVTGSQHLFGDGEQIANELRRRVREELDITISVGVSFNKVFAKLGSDFKKPDATTIISRENYKQMLFPLPARAMLYVGHAAAEQLSRHGIQTIGDIANAGREQMHALLGKTGESIWLYSTGQDETPVKKITERDPAKSVGNGMTFPRNLLTQEDIRTSLLMLCDNVGTRLRRQGLYCTTLQVQIKDPSLKVISRQRKLAAPTNNTHQLHEIALAIVDDAWKKGAPIRLLAVNATGLTYQPGVQLNLLEDTTKQDKLKKLDSAVDGIRKKYGEDALQFGSTIDTDLK
ncbi:DNA polymerase IV [Eubacteriales bacterium OttesenSCG-928-K08]|nr:DNA polymerase IV [Eubacteriales bacterium OttesenSCG-928-K08]